jgi:hypothetical protein
MTRRRAPRIIKLRKNRKHGYALLLQIVIVVDVAVGDSLFVIVVVVVVTTSTVAVVIVVLEITKFRSETFVQFQRNDLRFVLLV